MWLCFNQGFLSAVALKNDPTKVMVRARRSEHLEAYFSGTTIIHTPKADYPYRVVVSREALTAVIVRYLERLNYTNFKASVVDKPLHDAYMQVWTAMTKVEETPHWERRNEGWERRLDEPAHSSSAGGPNMPVGTVGKSKRRKWCSGCDSYVTRNEQDNVCTWHACPCPHGV